MQLVGIKDLSDRWQYLPREIKVITNSKTFPKPYATVDNRKAWELTDIEAYEADKPELRNSNRSKKLRGFLIGFVIALVGGLTAGVVEIISECLGLRGISEIIVRYITFGSIVAASTLLSLWWSNKNMQAELYKINGG